MAPVADILAAAVARTRAWPTPARYAATVAIVGAVLLLLRLADPVLPPITPYLPFFLAVLPAAALFDHGCGLLAIVLSALLVVALEQASLSELLVLDPRDLVGLGLFVGIGAAMTFVIESLHVALAREQAANAALVRSERSRTLLLREFRHRTRNDLGSLVALLHLRARGASSEAVREGLREAAQHAKALARVHTRLAEAEGDAVALADTRDFVLGLCADLEAATAGDGLRPVALLAEAESHPLDSERAVQLGLVLNEAVTNALKYAFPEERPGAVRVAFRRDGPNFTLTVADDGIGVPPEGEVTDAPPAQPPRGSGMGTRLLRSLAAQLRGSFSRWPGEGGVGTVTELRFPVRAPALPRA